MVESHCRFFGGSQPGTGAGGIAHQISVIHSVHGKEYEFADIMQQTGGEGGRIHHLNPSGKGGGDYSRRHRMPPKAGGIGSMFGPDQPHRLRAKHGNDDAIDLVESQACHRVEHVRGGFRPSEKGAVASLQRFGGQCRIVADQLHDAVNIAVGVGKKVEQLNGHNRCRRQVLHPVYVMVK
jgi:hypothetical protein